MSTLSPAIIPTPEEVEAACERDEKLYELVDGELKEKQVGAQALFIATRIAALLNAFFYPHVGAAACEVMIYCFGTKRQGRKPDVVYIQLSRLPGGVLPEGDVFIAPDLVVEVLSPKNSGMEIDRKIGEYLDAGVPLVWIVNPETRTIRAYRQDGSQRIFRISEVIENEPALPGFRLTVGGIFPAPAKPTV